MNIAFCQLKGRVKTRKGSSGGLYGGGIYSGGVCLEDG